MSSTRFDLDHVRTINLPRHTRADGEVVVAEAATVPFRIERLCTLTAPSGRHAHRQCSQFMICVSGAVDVVCEDGGQQKNSCLIEAMLPS